MSDAGKYKLIQAEGNSEWDGFVEASPQGSIFFLSEYMKNAVSRHVFYYVLKGNEKKAGLSLVLTADGNGCELDDLVIYNGLIFNEGREMKKTKARSERFEITEFIINELKDRYSNTELALSPHFEDQRPFLWHNYHSDDSADRFIVDLRYTSYLDISELAEDKPEEETLIFKDLETIRQRNIREARSVDYTFEEGLEADLFIDYYRQLMLAQGEAPEDEKLERMKNLIVSLVSGGKAVMFLAKSGNKIIYITVFGLDSKRAYYLFGAGDMDSAERYKGTIAFWDAFRVLAKDRGIKEVDMEGVNSPKRGWFKLSFGGDLRTYFKVYKQREG